MKIDFNYWDLQVRDIFYVLTFLIRSYLFKYIPNKEIKNFEKKVSKYLGCREAILVSSGTGALHSVLYCLNIKEGDEVITSPLSFSSSINAIKLVGAKPVFIDVKKDTYNINSDLIEKSINKNTKAILVVDLFGNPCDYDSLVSICKRHKIFLIADSAQAFGSQYREKRLGGIADFTCFSFDYNKNITSLTGGLITTNNSKLALKMRSFINYGLFNKDKLNSFGWNYKSNDLSACLLSSQLSRIDNLIKERNKFASFYRKIIKNKYQLQFIDKENLLNYNYLTINLKNGKNAKRLVNELNSCNIELSLFRCYLLDKSLNYETRKLPNFNRLKNSLVRLPMNKKLRLKYYREYIKKTLINLLKSS